MEICDSASGAASIPHCFGPRATPYLRQPYDLSSHPITSTINTPSPYLSYAYGHTFSHDVTQPTSHVLQTERNTNAMDVDMFYRNRLHQENPVVTTSIHHQTNGSIFRGFKTTSTCNQIDCNNTSPLNSYPLTSVNHLHANGLEKPDSPWKESAKSLRTVNRPRSLVEAPHTDLLLHHMQTLSQWDVNDPKLPKIRQFDLFTIWAQGNCRFAYQKSASDGARRHASGWAMRNTNNHNAQILKKSCLGVLLCTSETCSLAMRPAICDKARRRQEGRQCCMLNCTGRVYNQPCRGHGGYPVTHFWREHGDTVYFQAKGTHDHVRPDLKPVRDTAARRRRQMQRDPPSSVAVCQTAVNGLRQPAVTTAARRMMMRSRAGAGAGETESEYELLPGQARKRIHSNDMSDKHAKLANDGSPVLTRLDWTDPSVNYGKRVTGSNESPSPNPRAEPIFPASPAFGRGQSDDYSNKIKSDGTLLNSYTVPASINYTASSNTGYQMQASNHKLLSTVYGLNTVPSMSGAQTDLFDYAMKLEQQQQQQQHPHSQFSESAVCGTFLKDLCDPVVKTLDFPYTPQHATADLIQQTKSINLFKYQQPPPIFPPISQANQGLGNCTLGGGNSESTSGGLNASWSTPSPPTGGGNSSLFGSEFRTVHQTSLDDTSAAPQFSLNGLAVESNNSSSHYASLMLPSWHAVNNNNNHISTSPTTTTCNTNNNNINYPSLFGPYDSPPTQSASLPHQQQNQPRFTNNYNSTPPEHYYGTRNSNGGLRVAGQEISPESLLTSSSLMQSTSTPVSHNQALVQRLSTHLNQSASPYSQPINYIPPVSFNLTSSDSQSTRLTGNSSAEGSGHSGSVDSVLSG